MSKEKTVEEKRAALILKYRNLRIDKEEREGDRVTYYLSKGEKKLVMLLLINQKTIGIAFVRELRDLVEKTGADKGIMVGNGKYTYSAKSSSPKLKVELIPRTLPVFDLFDHEMVSHAKLVSDEEKRKLMEKYHAKLYQFPWIKAADPVSIILGAEPGDVISIKTKSLTAGISDSFRYVV